ncbi:MAG: Gfo/Idh/MocA family oxidoreductase [Candidatus Levybacteria bacterium]|nr:Gfo/Idh/MocA family oxidoreductase [Candidatus Levybacteria bacterium]
MKTIGVAVFGAGYWGPNLIRNFHALPEANVVAVCDLDKTRLSHVQTLYPSIKTTTQSGDVFSDPTVHAVAIATPLATHFPLAKKALIADKHVLLEKPFTRTVREAEELIMLSEKKHLVLFAGHTYVYNTAIQKIKKVLSQKKLGKVYYYESMRANLGLIQHDANVIWDLAPHDFSILNYIFPTKPLAIRVLSSRFVHSRQEEVAHVFVRYENNLFAHMYLSWLSPLKIRMTMLAGSKKMLVFDQQNPVEQIRLYDKGVMVTKDKNNSLRSSYRYGDVIVPALDDTEALSTELRHFLSCIREKQKPLTGGKEGLEIVKLLEAADRSLKSGKEILLR